MSVSSEGASPGRISSPALSTDMSTSGDNYTPSELHDEALGNTKYESLVVVYLGNSLVFQQSITH